MSVRRNEAGFFAEGSATPQGSSKRGAGNAENWRTTGRGWRSCGGLWKRKARLTEHQPGGVQRVTEVNVALGLRPRRALSSPLTVQIEHHHEDACNPERILKSKI